MEKEKKINSGTYLLNVVKAVYPFLIISVIAEFLIRIILKPLTLQFNGFNYYISLVLEGIRNGQLFGEIFMLILPVFKPLVIFAAVRYVVDIIANPGLYNACILYFTQDEASHLKDIIPHTGKKFSRYLKYRLLMLGIWIAYLVFCAIVMSSLMMIGLFLGETAVAYFIFLFVIFIAATIAMPLRISLAYPLSRIDGYHLDDALKQSIKATSEPYNYIRLLLIYMPAFLLQIFLISVFPLGNPELSMSHFFLASLVAGIVRFLTVCFTTSACMEMRKPREFDLNSIW